MEKKETIIITGSQHDRTWELDYNFIPANDQEFIDTVANAPRKTLLGMGFAFWESINKVIAENANKPEHDQISIPTYGIDLKPTGETITFDVGRKNAPTQPLSEEMDILLIPAEWYNSIPEGFEIYGLSGEKENFKKGETDDDRRFGCLAYGILRPTEKAKP